MKIVTVYFDDTDPMGYPFSSQFYLKAYQYFTDQCAKNGIDLRIARGAQSYLGDLQFQSGYLLRNNQPYPINHSFRSDYIYIKGKKQPFSDTEKVLNVSSIRSLCNDKISTFEAFPEHAVPAFPIAPDSIHDALEKIETETVVIKPNNGEEGRDILIIEKSKLEPHMISTREAMAIQPFVETSGGVPGFSKDRHDHRILIANGSIVYTYVRTPPKGRFLANVSLGASLKFLPIDRIPNETHTIIQAVEKEFLRYSPRLYAIDIVYNSGAPKIIELNEQPAIPDLAWGEESVAFYPMIISLFWEGINNSTT